MSAQSKRNKGKDLVEISISDGRELILDRLQEPDSDVKPVVGPVAELFRVLHGPKRTSSLRLHIKGTSRVPPAHTHPTSRTVSHTTIHSPLQSLYDEIPSQRERAYAIRSMSGAQFFSAMRPLSFLLHFSTAFLYSALTVGYDFPMILPLSHNQPDQNARARPHTTSSLSDRRHPPPPPSANAETQPTTRRDDDLNSAPTQAPGIEPRSGHRSKRNAEERKSVDDRRIGTYLRSRESRNGRRQTLSESLSTGSPEGEEEEDDDEEVS